MKNHTTRVESAPAGNQDSALDAQSPHDSEVIQALRETERRYRSLFENLLDGYAHHRIITDASGKPIDYVFLEVNRAFEVLTGLKRAEIVGRRVTEVIPGIDKSPRDWIGIYGRVALSGEQAHFEEFSEELKKWFRVSAFSPRHQYFVTVFEDVTERKRTDNALKANEERFRALVENSSDKIAVLDARGAFLYVSPSVKRLLGYEPEELLQRNAFDLIHPEDVLGVQQLFQQLLESGKDTNASYRFRHKNGEWRYLESLGRHLLDYPSVRGIVVNSRDITESRRIESERMRLATAVQQAGEAIIMTDREGLIQYVNTAFEKITGWSGNEVLGREITAFYSADLSQPLFAEVWGALTSGESSRVRFNNHNRNGNVYEEEVTVWPVRTNGDAVTNYVLMAREITREVELENRLLQAQKLEAVGRLAAGVAHDFNNLMAGIRGFAELILKEAHDSPRLSDYGNHILISANRAADLTAQLLAFSRQGKYLAIPVDIHQLIRDVEKILRRTLNKEITITLKLEAESCIIKGDPSQLQSALLNLAVNAIDAMPNGGRLTFATEVTTLPQDYCKEHGLKEGVTDYLRISTADSGVGMAPGILPLIFDPFFTTKEQGKGTGLGLAGVYGCVKNHEGHIEVSSAPGEGSTFTMYLPLTDGLAVIAQEPHRQERRGRADCILVVIDDERVGKQAQEILTKAGYDVILCDSGQEAVNAFRLAVERVSLVLIDLDTAGINGTETVSQLRKYNPQIGAILMTSLSEQTAEVASGNGILGFVQKPFQMRSLLLAVGDGLRLSVKRQNQLVSS